ncbi:MAG: DNA mismatch repair endonuclease MutL [Lentimicrobiaceae bacterium]|nr:DNA mismatch repair endonuclease MutL [Lentimicrobiaceae bacterium]
MHDIIRLLPDSVANQIAAGEVIQRPASAVKELLENAIDAGATEVQLNIKDAGKTLIQVVDNGCGMSVSDARMSFERHATSKIREANDLFAIRTMGFRGEALASVAAIAQVELKTKRAEDELGTRIEVEGSVVKDQQPCVCQDGTVLSVKNLFFNVPARRVFLKSLLAETNHILDEFYRVAIARNEIAFSFFHNEKNVFSLSKSSLKQRIVALMGNTYNERLIPVESSTSAITIGGFIGKPEFARKTRGEQFFFVNRRFIKHAYLHHSVENAFLELLPHNTYPSYFLFIEVDPKTIDINIHPTKTEVNFQDSKIVYAVLQSAVKQALGKYSLTPSLDFETERSLDIPPLVGGQMPKPPTITINPDYNPFGNIRQGFERNFTHNRDIEKLFSAGSSKDIPPSVQQNMTVEWDEDTEIQQNKAIFSIQKRYIVCNIKSGLMIIDLQKARERILFDRLMSEMENNQESAQQLLFPHTVHLTGTDAEVLLSLLPQLQNIGFEISQFGKNTFIVNGVPASMSEFDIQLLLEDMVENFNKQKTDLTIDKKTNLAFSIAKSLTSKLPQNLPEKAMQTLIDQLFASSIPHTSPSGKPTLTIINFEEISSRFK